MAKKSINFSEKVLNITRRIPKGRITTYKDIAKALGDPKAARAVGNALNKNKNLVKIPCHRVIKSDGHIGGYARGEKEKIQLLRSEGVLVENGKIKNLKKVLLVFSIPRSLCGGVTDVI